MPVCTKGRWRRPKHLVGAAHSAAEPGRNEVEDPALFIVARLFGKPASTVSGRATGPGCFEAGVVGIVAHPDGGVCPRGRWSGHANHRVAVRRRLSGDWEPALSRQPHRRHVSGAGRLRWVRRGIGSVWMDAPGRRTRSWPRCGSGSASLVDRGVRRRSGVGGFAWGPGIIWMAPRRSGARGQWFRARRRGGVSRVGRFDDIIRYSTTRF